MRRAQFDSASGTFLRLIRICGKSPIIQLCWNYTLLAIQYGPPIIFTVGVYTICKDGLESWADNVNSARYWTRHKFAQRDIESWGSIMRSNQSKFRIKLMRENLFSKGNCKTWNICINHIFNEIELNCMRAQHSVGFKSVWPLWVKVDDHLENGRSLKIDLLWK